ncbi:hypothetical protein ACVILH_002009 [Bradyrhizobium sp. USDA 4353]
MAESRTRIVADRGAVLVGFVHAPAMHVSIAIGIVVTFLSLLELWLAHDPDFAGDRL